MGYDRGDSFPLDFEPNGIPFGSKSKGEPSPRSYPIERERKWKYSFLSAFCGSDLCKSSIPEAGLTSNQMDLSEVILC